MISKKIIQLLHWGPLITLAVISTIVGMVTRSVLSSPLLRYNYINLACLILELILVMRSYLMACFVEPGIVPYSWSPEDKNSPDQPFCDLCQCFKPYRAHHCSKCDRCVLKMDHHCPWINACCGHHNQVYFFHFLLAVPVSCLHSAVILFLELVPFMTQVLFEPNDLYFMDLIKPAAVLSALVLALVVTFMVGFLLIIQIRNILTNQTSVEACIVRSMIRRNVLPEDAIINPYDLGYWENIEQVLTWSGKALGDGYHWPVKSNSEKYLLTLKEFMETKGLCRRCTEVYQVVRPYGGDFFSLFLDFGANDWMCHPCNDEPKLPLKPGQLVGVTRRTRKWLYGHLLDSTLQASARKCELPVRGWFPATCAEKSKEPNLKEE